MTAAMLLAKDGKKIAVLEADRIGTISPVCTHLKCIVHWNNTEKPGTARVNSSRFAVTGEVIEGPAIAPLTKYNLSKPASAIHTHETKNR